MTSKLLYLLIVSISLLSTTTFSMVNLKRNQLIRNTHQRYETSSLSTKLLLVPERNPPDLQRDHYDTFSNFDKFLFNRFSASVAEETNRISHDKKSPPKSYRDLMDRINGLVFSQAPEKVHFHARNMLVKLFPRWLLDQFKVMFARPFPQFSNWMNAWVTHFTTGWLMGPSIVESTSSGGYVVVVEKCRFLEESGPCLKTCLHACKIPTQDFFAKDMGITVTLSPNVTDYSCRFEFGVEPKRLEDDPISLSPCFTSCNKRKKSPQGEIHLDACK